MTEQPERREFTTTQAAEWLTSHGLQKSGRTVSRYIDDGLIAARRTKGGQRRIRLYVLQCYLRDHS